MFRVNRVQANMCVYEGERKRKARVCGCGMCVRACVCVGVGVYLYACLGAYRIMRVALLLQFAA